MTENIPSLHPPENWRDFVAYTAALHDIIAAYHQRLAEVTSPKVAAHLFANVSDKAMAVAMQRLGITEEGEHTEQKLKEFMSRLGLTFGITKVGDTWNCRFDCPFAEMIHPLITAKNPMCPVSAFILGLARKHDRTAIMSSIELTETGAECKISPD